MIQKKLEQFINNEARFDKRHYGLDGITAILDHFGNPHRYIPSFHVAGTNGKGSVAHMLNAMLTGAGYKTGLFTSPHLLDINERIRISDAMIDDVQFETYIDEIAKYVATNPSITTTYFDVLTVCAFRYFSDLHANCTIIETGLGGRLDSTNVITPIASIITDISRDHVGILGNTISAISREKAGIIKKDIPVITSNTNPEILEPIIYAATHHGSPQYLFSNNFHAMNTNETDTGFRFDYLLEAFPTKAIPGIICNHPLEKQVVNASCAITASVITRPFFPDLTDQAIRNGIAAFSAPGRFQTLCRNPLVLFDPAHNEAALYEMVRLVARKFPDRPRTFVISLMNDKEIGAIMTMLATLGVRAFYYVLDDPRCFVPHRGDYADVITEIITSDEAGLASELDRSASAESLFFFTGSFRLYRTALNYAGHACIKCS
jgi:dihydrofolate synthase / folylpolyglutamate synthase